MNHTEIACFSDGLRYARDKRKVPPEYARGSMEAWDGIVTTRTPESSYFWEGYEEGMRILSHEGSYA